MKNLHLFLPVIYFLVLITSCGPSKEEIEAREKQIADSTAAAQTLILTQAAETPAPTPTTPAVYNQKTYANNANFIISIYNVNGCEYISFKGDGGGIVHAGNCSNGVHYQNQQPTHHEDFPIN